MERMAFGVCSRSIRGRLGAVGITTSSSRVTTLRTRIPTAPRCQSTPLRSTPSSLSPSRRHYSSSSTPPPPAPLDPPADLDAKERAVFEQLVAGLQPVELVVKDVSGGCGSMYAIEIASEKFRGLGMLAQQRLVNKVLKSEIGGWHGVQLRTRVP